jgi:hypothetical protein
MSGRLLFDDAFADTDPITLAAVHVPAEKLYTCIFVSAVDEDMTIEIQAQDPNGAWHTIDTNTTTADTTDAIAIGNVDHLRIIITPAAAPSSAVVWVFSYGG